LWYVQTGPWSITARGPQFDATINSEERGGEREGGRNRERERGRERERERNTVNEIRESLRQ